MKLCLPCFCVHLLVWVDAFHDSKTTYDILPQVHYCRSTGSGGGSGAGVVVVVVAVVVEMESAIGVGVGVQLRVK